MKCSGGGVLSLCSMAVSAWVVITALNWPLTAALFPVAIGVPVFFMTLSEFYFNFSRKGGLPQEGAHVDFKLSENVDQRLANRRTIAIFVWILSFFVLIAFVGFPIAVPLFFVLFLKFSGRKGWKISLGMAGLAWACFFGLFVMLLHTPFQEGWIQRWLRIMKIG